MTRKFKTVDYEAALTTQTVSLREALPANHLARFVVDIVAELDLAHIYERYGLRGGEAYAPELLLGLLFYGYATGVFSSRKIEKATGERSLSVSGGRAAPGSRHARELSARRFWPRSTICSSRCCYWPRRGAISSSATSAWTAPRCMRMLPRVRPSATSACWHWRPLACRSRSVVRLAEQADGHEVPAGMNVTDEIVLRQERLARLAEAKQVLEAGLRSARRPNRPSTKPNNARREAKAQRTGRKPRRQSADTAGIRTASQGPIQLYRS